MKRLIPMLLCVVAGSAQAQGAFNPFNPAGMLNPMAGGYGGYGANMGNPLGALAGPLLLNPQLALAALGALGTLAPLLAPTLAPNMLTHGHFNPMAHPHAGSPFTGNPFMRLEPALPFATHSFSPSIPSRPGMPFAMPSQQPHNPFVVLLPMQQPQLAMPSLPFMPPQAPPPARHPGLATPWQPSPAPGGFMMPPTMAPQQPRLGTFQLPFQPQQSPQPTGFFAMPPQATGAAPPAAVATPQQPTWPFFAPAAAPAPSPAPASPAQPDASVPAPIDPAAFLQMLMQPREAPKQP